MFGFFQYFLKKLAMAHVVSSTAFQLQLVVVPGQLAGRRATDPGSSDDDAVGVENAHEDLRRFGRKIDGLVWLKYTKWWTFQIFN